jgi:hypothetical protein
MSDSSSVPRRREGDEFVEYRFRELKELIDKLDTAKASKESVEAIRGSMNDLKDAFDSLKKILIGAALSWVAGSAMFLFTVLQIKGK